MSLGESVLAVDESYLVDDQTNKLPLLICYVELCLVLGTEQRLWSYIKQPQLWVPKSQLPSDLPGQWEQLRTTHLAHFHVISLLAQLICLNALGLQTCDLIPHQSCRCQQQFF